jgi:hypothetical protein
VKVFFAPAVDDVEILVHESSVSFRRRAGQAIDGTNAGWALPLAHIRLSAVRRDCRPSGPLQPLPFCADELQRAYWHAGDGGRDG